jgi:hypothetical protein
MTKREEIEKFEKAVRENDKAAMFEYLVNEIIEAGIPPPATRRPAKSLFRFV